MEIEEINQLIRPLEEQLAPLYELRRGKAQFRGNTLYRAWCKVCGRITVDPHNGEDTCPICLGK